MKGCAGAKDKYTSVVKGITGCLLLLTEQLCNLDVAMADVVLDFLNAYLRKTYGPTVAGSLDGSKILPVLSNELSMECWWRIGNTVIFLKMD